MKCFAYWVAVPGWASHEAFSRLLSIKSLPIPTQLSFLLQLPSSPASILRPTLTSSRHYANIKLLPQDHHEFSVEHSGHHYLTTRQGWKARCYLPIELKHGPTCHGKCQHSPESSGGTARAAGFHSTMHRYPSGYEDRSLVGENDRDDRE